MPAVKRLLLRHLVSVTTDNRAIKLLNHGVKKLLQIGVAGSDIRQAGSSESGHRLSLTY
jgi:hypothetical protein